MHLDQLGHARHLAQRTDPGQAGKAITVGSLRHADQQPAASQIRQPGQRGRKTQVYQRLGRYEHFLIRPGQRITLQGTKVLPHDVRHLCQRPACGCPPACPPSAS